MRRYTAAGALLTLLLAACTDSAPPSDPPGASSPTSPTPTDSATTSSSPPAARAFDPADVVIGLDEVAGGFSSPLYLTHAGDGSGRLYVVEQGGVIRSIDADGGARRRFLDIAGRVGSGGERGLLGLAFHPDYERNGRLFVNYTGNDGDTRISEFRRDGRTADPASERVLLEIEQPFANHNGGMIAFGPDGFLSISTGDGGSAGDPGNRGQRRDTLLGKILRIDVDGDRPYAIPAGNPFVDREGARPEIWAYGLRNPWRFSFDRETGDMFIGDVGQGALEEIDFQPAGKAGLNYGWRIMEGDRCYRTNPCDRGRLTLPVAVYPTDEGCAVTGGYVYRGSRFPILRGGYLFSDYCNGTIWGLSAARAARGSAPHRTLRDTDLGIVSFGEDEQGELYVTDLNGGGVYRITARRR